MCIACLKYRTFYSVSYCVSREKKKFYHSQYDFKEIGYFRHVPLFLPFIKCVSISKDPGGCKAYFYVIQAAKALAVYGYVCVLLYATPNSQSNEIAVQFNASFSPRNSEPIHSMLLIIRREKDKTPRPISG